MLPRIEMEGGAIDDPELRFTTNGTALARVRLIAKDRKRGANGEWEDGDPCFLTVTVFGRTAEHVAETVTKGSTVMVTGKLQQREWEADDGSKRTTYEVLADTIGVGLRWNAWSKIESERQAPPAQVDQPAVVSDGDIPF